MRQQAGETRIAAHNLTWVARRIPGANSTGVASAESGGLAGAGLAFALFQQPEERLGFGIAGAEL